jgi:hypothetical protein
MNLREKGFAVFGRFGNAERIGHVFLSKRRGGQRRTNGQRTWERAVYKYQNRWKAIYHQDGSTEIIINNISRADEREAPAQLCVDRTAASL